MVHICWRCPNLYPIDKQHIKLGTFLAVRRGEGISCQTRADCPWLLMDPPVARGPNVHRKMLPQCPVGSATIKMTEIRSSFELSDIEAAHCPHKQVLRRQPPTGCWLRSASNPKADFLRSRPLNGNVCRLRIGTFHARSLSFAYPPRHCVCVWP